MAVEIGTFEAKNRLSALLDRVQQGESIYITRRGKRVAQLCPVYDEQEPLPRFGSAKGEFEMSDDFDAPLEDFAEYTP